LILQFLRSGRYFCLGLTADLDWIGASGIPAEEVCAGFTIAEKRIKPARIIAWSLWRRAHQAVARRAHIKAKRQL
jgi:hypothetical protein